VFEIYVYSPEMRHPPARGQDRARRPALVGSPGYCTEVYGLMRAQLTKNAIIVPAGAISGLPEGPSEQGEVERQYVTFIRSLLSVTDNLVDGKVVQPAHVRCATDDTTSWSPPTRHGDVLDTANRVSQVRLGSTTRSRRAARPATTWCRHRARGLGVGQAALPRAGVAPGADPFTVVGIGDMSGDVFGNGAVVGRPARRRLRSPARLHRP
jgi:glutamate dehydrogenase